MWLLVSPLNPLKQANTAVFAPYEDRFNMTALAVDDIEGLRASDFESHLPLPSYMFNTLNELSRAYPQHQFVLVIGADNWIDFNKWYKCEEIKSNYEILIYRRPGYDLPNYIKVVETPLYDISSTEIRQSIQNGVYDARWLSPKVIEYIKEHKLYLTIETSKR